VAVALAAEPHSLRVMYPRTYKDTPTLVRTLVQASLPPTHKHTQ
jgi:hypothetical protein